MRLLKTGPYVPGDEKTSVAVMPSIRSRGSVAAVDTVGEAVEVMRQMIEVSERHVPIKGCADGLSTIRVCNSCILCMLRTSTFVANFQLRALSTA